MEAAILIEVLIVDLCALALAPELRARLLLDQAEKDGLKLFCYAQLPRENLRYALRKLGYLEYFDGLFYDELMQELTGIELRLLASSSTLWMRQPEEINYLLLLPLLPARKRLLPRALRMQKLLAEGVTFNETEDYPPDEDSYGEEPEEASS